MSFKIAYCAGHYIGTAGKRVPKALDASQTREWTLNDRVADYFARAALEYQDVEILRTDDPTGKKKISIKDRTKKANDWGADLYVDMHHNAAGKVFDGGGVVAISKKNDALGAKYRDAIYAAVVAAGGLKGNRSNPTYAKNYNTMVYAKMTALIIEYGFMDSRVDYPIISTDAYAKAVAYATMEAIAKVKGLKKRPAEPVPDTTPKCTLTLRVLERGMKGNDVKTVQMLLLSYGFKMTNNGKTYTADSSFGPATQNAVKNYQKSRGLTVTGKCDQATWSSLLGLV